MKDFPLSAKIFVYSVVTGGLIVIGPSLVTCDYRRPLELFLFLILAALAGSKKIRLIRSKSAESTCTMSVAFAVTFAAMLHFGPAGGALVGLVSGLSACLYPKRQPLYQTAFNVSDISITAYVSAYVLMAFGILPGALEASDILNSTLPLVLSTLTYYLLNTVSVATAIALSSRGSTIKIWHDHFLWTAPGFFAGASCAVIAEILYHELNRNLMLLALPILYLTYYSYKIYVEKAEQSQRHIEELQMGQEQLAALYLATIESLATAIDAKDTYTREHINRVQMIAVKIAIAMGLSGSDLEGIRTAALLHDIGKLGVPEHILLKPGKLTLEEYQKVQKHSTIGAKILDPVQFPWPVAAVVRCHHEKFDGTGYPDGLKGEDIPLGARVLAIADVYDALTSDRSYREGWSHENAVEHIKSLSGTHFDPNVVEAFVSIADEIAVFAQSSKQIHKENEQGDENQEHRGEHDAADDIARANHELMALFELAQTLSTTLNLDEVLILLANKIKNVIRASSCVIFLKDTEQPETMVADVAVGVNRDHFTGAVVSTGEGKTGQVVETCEPYIGLYDKSDVVLQSTYSDWTPLQSALIVPLVCDDQRLGTLNVYHTEANAFSADDLRVLLVVAKQAGTAVQNARIFEQTRESAIRDPLTGLHNIRFLFSNLEQELSRAQRFGRALSVLGIDLDNFKLINDNFGHQKGDAVLKDVSQILRQSVREYDLIVRYSGDEFIVVLPETDLNEAQKTAARIKQAIAGYASRLPSRNLAPLGASIGIASYPNDGGDVKTLLAKADAAMYEDKRARKGQSMAA
ncbi:MAG TPA: diguanylate cyclase [Armatimonadota bacterium]|nr:diguanylate cyclase [Armatimonadota bacterium]